LLSDRSPLLGHSYGRTPFGVHAVASAAQRDTEPAEIGARDVQEAREQAEEWLREYAEALRFWNAPDDEHTRIQLRRLVDDVIQETVPVACSVDGGEQT
jgi:hypothetical protein